MITELVIGICDDEEPVHRLIQEHLQLYGQQQGVKIQTERFSTGVELLDKMPGLDMLLLDIDMPGMDGIETARELNKRGIGYKIILLTGKTERFKDGYKVGAFRFVTKPVDRTELYEAVTEVRKRMLGIDKIQVYLDNRAYWIPQKDILYVMADKAQTKIFTRNCEYRSEASLVQWEKQLEPKLFCKTHRAFLVNLSQIEHLDKELLILTSGEKITVSRRQRKSFLEAFMNYDTKYR